MLKKIGVFGKDAEHLASAYCYQERENIKVVFVSFDYSHIVNKFKEIYETIHKGKGERDKFFTRCVELCFVGRFERFIGRGRIKEKW